MYYMEGLSQNEIAARLFISRSRVSRMLQEARNIGLVEIKVHFVTERCPQLESALRQAYGLKDIRVYNDVGHNLTETFEMVCSAAGEYLQTHLRPNSIVGITRGAVLAEVIKALKAQEPMNLKCVQVMGQEADPDPEVAAPDLIRKIISKFGGQAYYLNTPIYVNNEHLKRALLAESCIRETIELAEKADIIVLGVGMLSAATRSSAVWRDFVQDSVFDQLESLGGVGYILGRVFDKEGRLLDHPLNQRIVGLEPEALRNIPRAIGVVSGVERSRAAEAALSGKYFNILITDRGCAEQIMKIYLDRQESK